MTIAQLIEILERRVAYLSALRTAAERLGDVEQLAQLDGELAESQATLATLRAI